MHQSPCFEIIQQLNQLWWRFPNEKKNQKSDFSSNIDLDQEFNQPSIY